MISSKFQTIFVHIPKTGGQSIEIFFLKLHNLTWQTKESLLLKKNLNPVLGPERLAHLKAEEYTKLNYISEAEFKSYYKFAFVRNPWARLVSEYHYGGYSTKSTFKDFVIKGFPPESEYTNKYRHIMQQCEYTHNKNGDQIVDFIGKLENIQNDFNIVCNKLMISQSELPHINSSPEKSENVIKKFFSKSKNTKKKHYSEYYDTALVDHVASLYSRDLEIFDYKFN